MNSARIVFNRQLAYMFAAAALLFAMVIPAIVSAATVTERSVQLSNSSVSATGVTYKVNFKAVGAAEAFVVDFCSNSPVVGQTCTPPTGFDATAAASATPNFTGVSDLDANTIVVVGSMASNNPVSVDVSGIVNPSAEGPMYARIITYDSSANANLYNGTLTAGNVDNGGVAMYITPTIGVSGAVLESLTFCVSKALPGANCTGADAPVLVLGETNDGVVALTSEEVSTGVLNTQISTNAASGAVIRLKSMTDCGGMKRVGATVCDIVPALAGATPTGDIVKGQARFGVKTAATTDTPLTTANGTLQPVVGSGYNNSTYVLNYLANNSTGVTSTFGDPFLDTADAPVNNKNMALTFGASISNDTPAGTYSTQMSMVATGKF